MPVSVTATVEPTPDDQAKLYAETDARFAAGTGITRKLDPANRLDARFIAAWHDLYKKVLAQWKAGTLAYTYDHPSIATELVNAGKAAGDAADHLSTMIAAKPANASDASSGSAGIGASQWAQTLAGQAAAAAANSTAKAAAAQATIEAANRAQQERDRRGARHGIAPMPPAPAVVAPDLVSRAAAEVMDDLRRGVAGIDRVIGNATDAIAAFQAQAAPARAAAVNQIATGAPVAAPAAVPAGDVAASSPTPPGKWIDRHPRIHEAGDYAKAHGGGIAIGMMAVAGVGLLALAIGGGGRRRPTRRRARSVRLRLA